MQNINTLIDNLTQNIDDITARLAEYCGGSSYIYDAINEIVDGACPVYWSGLLQWFNECSDSQDYVNDAVREYGIDSSNFDIFKAIQWGYCKKAEETIYNEKNDGLLLAAYVLIRDSYKLEEITDEQTEEIENIDFDRIDTFTDLQDEIEQIINPDNE